jgi:hypothetical protein
MRAQNRHYSQPKQLSVNPKEQRLEDLDPDHHQGMQVVLVHVQKAPKEVRKKVAAKRSKN